MHLDINSHIMFEDRISRDVFVPQLFAPFFRAEIKKRIGKCKIVIYDNLSLKMYGICINDSFYFICNIMNND